MGSMNRYLAAVAIAIVVTAAPASAGNPIVFSRVDASMNFPDSELYSIGLDGKGLQRLTDNAKGDASPSWSPNGKRLVFECRGAVGDEGFQTRGEICVMRADGTRQRQLTDTGADVGFHEPTWSPNGRWIAFTRYRRCDPCSTDQTFVSDLMLMRPDGSDLHALTDDAKSDAHPTWAPGSQRLAFIHETEDGFGIAIIGVDGGDPSQVTSAAFMQDREPAWSPDGKTIAFIRLQEHHSDLVLVKPNGTDARVVVKGGAPGWPAWSPSGKRLVFTRDDDLFRVGRDGNGLTRITGSSATNKYLEFDADWR